MVVMPAERWLPSDYILKRWLDEGHTHREMAEMASKHAGHHIGRSAISAWVSRMGYATRPASYKDTIPWSVQERHRGAYDLWMLRLHHRLRHGTPVPDVERARHDAWLRQLRDEDAVVMYDPETLYGFHWVARAPGDTDVIRPPADYGRIVDAWKKRMTKG